MDEQSHRVANHLGETSPNPNGERERVGHHIPRVETHIAYSEKHLLVNIRCLRLLWNCPQELLPMDFHDEMREPREKR